MFAVIFEVEPKRERWDDYFETAKRLRPELERIDGFVDNERFRHLTRPERVLSLSIWRDEAALIRWRMLAIHRQAQERGRREIFSDYHLRVGEVVADSAGMALPQRGLDATQAGAAFVTIAELAPIGGVEDIGLSATEGACTEVSGFESLTTPGKGLWLASWRDAASAESWTPRAPTGATLRRRRVRIIRDYGMDDRREAPQHYPPVER